MVYNADLEGPELSEICWRKPSRFESENGHQKLGNKKMRKCAYKKEKEVVEGIEVEDSVIFGLMDRTDEMDSPWFRFCVNIDLGSCSSLGNLEFNTSSEHLKKLSNVLLEWSEKLAQLESHYNAEFEEITNKEKDLTQKALDKLSEEEKRLLKVKF